jgi:peptidoglycan hydrolase-like protein with peptidoglycan-binding domain
VVTEGAIAGACEYRRELQRKKKNEGYYNGAIDGAFGPGTIAAIRKVAAG